MFYAMLTMEAFKIDLVTEMPTRNEGIYRRLYYLEGVCMGLPNE